VDPAPGERVDWDSQTFRAQASDPGGGALATYDWKITHGSETVDDVDGDGNDGADGKSPTLTELPYDSSAYYDTITIELTVIDLENQSVTIRQTRGNLACRVLYEACSKDKECCSGTCACSGGNCSCFSG
jgi:hypothetical protein